jgi:undecaprenyl pyrophosphate synthase
MIGSRKKLPPSLQKVLDQIEASTENQTESSHLTMCLAINYGGRRDVLWPNFVENCLKKALEWFSKHD